MRGNIFDYLVHHCIPITWNGAWLLCKHALNKY